MESKLQQIAMAESRRSRRRRLANIGPAMPFILPGLVLAAVFVLYPMLFNLRISFSSYQIVQRSMRFTGLDNYLALLADPQRRLLMAIRNNLLYALVTTPFILFLGLLFAVMIERLRKSKVLFRTLFYLPVITSWVIVGNVFSYMFESGSRGLVNYLLVDVLGLMDGYVTWLKQTWTANAVIWMMGIWKNIGWAMIIYIAGLQGIPGELYEASRIDGAGGARQFLSVTVPLLKPTTYFVMVNMVIGSFNVFLQVMMLTGGNPRGTTSVLQYMLYDRSFNLFDFGQGAAIGLMTAVLILLVTLLLNKLLKTQGGGGAR